VCHWGKLEFDLADVLTAALWICHKSQHPIPPELYSCPGLTGASEMATFHGSILGFTHKVQYSLGDMMLSTQIFEKTEPRDSVYAILGLLKSKEASSDRGTALLEVNYAKPVPDIMRDATRYALSESGHLGSVIGASCGLYDEAADDGFATWAMWVYQSRGLDPIPQFAPDCELGWACRGLEPATLLADVSRGPGVLLGEGFITDRAIVTTIPYNEGIYDYDGLYHWLISVKDLFLKSYDHDADTKYFALASTLVVGRERSMRRAQPDDLAMFKSYLKSLNVLEDIPPPTDPNGERAEHLQALVDSTQASSLYCCHRRFFVTAEGRMGLGPSSMQAGDLVVVLRGGSLPLILRESDALYWLIGPAYVHGIMDGEAVQEWKARNEPEQVFPIV